MKRLFTAFAPLLALGLVASAQTPQSGTQKDPKPAHQPGDTTTRPADTKPVSVNRGLKLVVANDIIGIKIVDPAGGEVGKLEDVIIYPRGEVPYALISLAGADKVIAIPWNVLQQPNVAGAVGTGDERKIVLAVDKERLKGAPAFDKKMADPNWTSAVDTYYANEKRSTTGRPMEASARTAGMPLLRASEIKGTNIESPTGDKIGDVKDAIVDPNGRIAFLVVSAGGFLGMGDRLVAVPFEAFKVKVDGDRKKLVLDTTKERLKEAPEFKSGRENWAAMSDPAYVMRVYEFYSVKPYWSDMDTGTGSGMGMDEKKSGTSGTGTGRTDKPDKPEKP